MRGQVGAPPLDFEHKKTRLEGGFEASYLLAKVSAVPALFKSGAPFGPLFLTWDAIFKAIHQTAEVGNRENCST